MSIKRLSLGILTLVILAVLIGNPVKSIETQANGQDFLMAGRNVNMVSGQVLPGGDPWLQRQNEPSMAVSTRNPMHLLAGSNDYRTVDIPESVGELPGKQGGVAAGDAWLGVYYSKDGGESWTSDMLPGYPQDPSNASPLKGYQAAADPVVRAGANGMFFYCGIAFDRDTHDGVIFVSRFIDNNNDEVGNPIKYLDTKIIATGNANFFVDKPWIAVDKPRWPGDSRTIEGQSIPRFNVYIAYAAFTDTSTDPRSQIYFARSRNCGNSWNNPIQISRGNSAHQGASIGIKPRSGSVFVTWRRFGRLSRPDRIYVAKSFTRGRSFQRPVRVADVTPFDQPTSAISELIPGETFRTNSYPTIACDDQSRIYIAWAENNMGPGGESRIVLSRSNFGGGWSTPYPIANGPDVGHQFMPSMAYAGGKLTAVWYDQRKTVYSYECGVGPWINDDPWSCTWRQTIDVYATQADSAQNPIFETPIPVSQYLFGLIVDEATQEAIIGPDGYAMAVQLQYNPPNYPLYMGGTVSFIGDYLDLTPSPMFVRDDNGRWQFNTAPTDNPVFHVTWTDNRDVRPPFDNIWTNYNPPSSNQGEFGIKDCGSVDLERTGMRNQNVYTSRLTRGVLVAAPGNNKPLGTLGSYHPDLGGGEIPRSFVIYVKNPTYLARSFRLEILENPQYAPASFMEFETTPTLDVNIAPYSTVARTVFAYSGGGSDIVRVEVYEIDGPGGSEVIDGLSNHVLLNPDPTAPPVQGDLYGNESHNPNIANPNIANPNILNWATSPNIANPNILNPNILNPNILNPNIINPNIANPNILNSNILNHNIANPNILNPNIANPNIANPNILNPNIANPNILNPNHTNTNPMNPNILNPNILNPNILNPNIANATPGELDNADIVDAFWLVNNEGNTASSYTFKMFSKEEAPRGIFFQLLIYRVHYTPVAPYAYGNAGSTMSANADGPQCDLMLEPHHELIQNVVNPNILNPNIANPNILNPNILNESIENTTFAVNPGEEVLINLRVMDITTDVPKLLSNGDIFNMVDYLESVGVGVTGHAPNTVERQTEPDPVLPSVATKLVIATPDGDPPDGYVGDNYYAGLVALGGNGNYYWELNSGALPPGLTISTHPSTNQGVISGQLQTEGIYDFVVKVSDGFSEPDTQAYTINVYPAGVTPTLEITTDSTLPGGVKGIQYGVTLKAIGGVAPRSFEMVEGHTLPAGLILDGGVINGTPQEHGTFGFAIRVRDANTPPDTATKTFSLTISDYDPDDPVTYPDISISGTVYNGLFGQSGVLLRGAPGSPETDLNGDYEIIVPYGWSGTLEPFHVDFDITPQSRTYSSLSVDQIGQDYNTVISETSEEWASMEVTASSDVLNDMTVNHEGNIYAAGSRDGDMLLVKFDSDGNREWSDQFGGLNDSFKAIATDPDGSVYVTGSNFHTMKYDHGGEFIWSDTYSFGEGLDEAEDIGLDANGNIYVAGYSQGVNSYDICTIKYAPSGNSYVREWVQRFDNGGTDSVACLEVDYQGNVLVGGRSFAGGSGQDMFIIKYSPEGNIIWTARHPVPQNDFVIDMVLDGPGNVYATGRTRDYPSAGTGIDICTIMVDADGHLNWAAYHDGGSGLNDTPNGIALDIEGNVYVTGFSVKDVGGVTHRDVITIKYNSDGGELWTEEYDGPVSMDDFGRDIIVDPFGYVYVTGPTIGSAIPDDYDLTTIKYTTNGTLEWVARYDNQNLTENAHRVALDPAGNVIVGGDSDGNLTILKYAQETIGLFLPMENLPFGVVSQEYNAVVEVYGGVPPYNWSITPQVPAPGLAMSSSGIISGIPSGTGDYPVTITVQDASQNIGYRDYTISIVPLPPTPASYFVITGNSTLAAGNAEDLTITAYNNEGVPALGYDGLKQLVFSGLGDAHDGSQPIVGGAPLGVPVHVNFDAGVSDAGTCTLVPYLAESATLVVSDENITTGGGASYDVMVTPGPGEVTLSSISDVSPLPAVVGTPLTVTVSVVDAVQNPSEGGDDVGVNWYGEEATFGSSAVFLGNGVYSLDTTPSTAENATIRATIDANWILQDGDGVSDGTWHLTVTGGGLSGNVVWVNPSYSQGGGNDGHVWDVDAFSTIQDGIDGISAPGIVHVAAAYYQENITLKNDIVVIGAGPDTTTIDGYAQGSVVTAVDLDNTTSIEGFTFTSGMAEVGGGMFNLNSSHRVENCHFTYNVANGTRDSVYTFTGGGAMYNEGTDSTTTCSPTVINCVFKGNETVVPDYASGGAVANWYHSHPIFVGCLFDGNDATVTDQLAQAKGGGMFSDYYCEPTIINCTFTSNALAADDPINTGGGGIYQSSGNLTIINSIFWGNNADIGLGHQIALLNSAPCNISYSLVQDKDSDGVFDEGPNLFAEGTGVIDTDPMLDEVNLLMAGSPCIDTGDNNAPGLPDDDFEGDQRIVNGTVDMGADEFETDPATKVSLSGPSTGPAGAILGPIVLNSLDDNDDPAYVTGDTTFDLDSLQAGTVLFFSDAAGETAPITQVTIASATTSASFYYRNTAVVNDTIDVVYVTGPVDLGPAEHDIDVTAATPATVSVETYEGVGNYVPLPNTALAPQETVTVYAVVRDTLGNFVETAVITTWQLVNIQGSVVPSDLSGDQAVAVFTANDPGSTQIRVLVNGLQSIDSGTITVTTPPTQSSQVLSEPELKPEGKN